MGIEEFFLIKLIDDFNELMLKWDIFSLNKLTPFILANFRNFLLIELGPKVQMILIFFFII